MEWISYAQPVQTGETDNTQKRKGEGTPGNQIYNGPKQDVKDERVEVSSRRNTIISLPMLH